MDSRIDSILSVPCPVHFPKRTVHESLWFYDERFQGYTDLNKTPNQITDIMNGWNGKSVGTWRF